MEKTPIYSPPHRRSSRTAIALGIIWLSAPIAMVTCGLLPISVELRTDTIPVVIELAYATIIGIATLAVTVVLIADRRWIFAGAAALVTLFFSLPMLSMFGLPSGVFERTWGNLAYANRVLCFLSLKHEYDQEIASSPNRDAIKLFVWHDGFEGGYGVAYDRSSELVRNAARLPAAPENPRNFTRGICTIDSVGSDYYLVSYGCTSKQGEHSPREVHSTRTVLKRRSLRSS